jgi:tRNA-dihydrouridine synthase B
VDFFGKKLFCAPLAGISDTVFRGICRENGADAVVSEMVSAEGLFYKSKPTQSLLLFSEKERPIGIQLFGAKPDHMARAAEHVQKTVQPDFIDLNSGCPVAKVVTKNGGASLLKDIRLFRELCTALVRAASVPVSVKIRSGWFEHQWVDVEFAQAAVECGARAIILHPRSKTMGFSGHSYWERIALVKKSVPVPVIGNGDVCSAEDGVAMFSQTDCDSVMIGRGALGNPWIFSQIKRAMAGLPYDFPSPSARIEAAARHLRLFTEAHGEKRACGEMKKHAAWYIKGLPGAAALRTTIFSAKNTSDIFLVLEEALKKG